jgi:hypothetical protein
VLSDGVHACTCRLRKARNAEREKQSRARAKEVKLRQEEATASSGDEDIEDKEVNITEKGGYKTPSKTRPTKTKSHTNRKPSSTKKPSSHLNSTIDEACHTPSQSKTTPSKKHNKRRPSSVKKTPKKKTTPRSAKRQKHASSNQTSNRYKSFYFILFPGWCSIWWCSIFNVVYNTDA